MRALPAVCVFGLVLAACVGDKTTGTASSSSSGGSSTSGGASSSTSSGGASGGTVLKTYDEEHGCSGWDPVGVALTPDSPGHDSAGACRACWQPSTDKYFYVNDYLDMPSAPGTTYELSAWFRLDGNSPAFHNAQLNLLTLDAQSMTIDRSSKGFVEADQWVFAAATLPITTAAPALKIEITGLVESDKPPCVVFDGVVLKKL